MIVKLARAARRAPRAELALQVGLLDADPA